MDNEKPTVSVIIPTYNRAHLIGRSIQSVLDQTYRDFEIIVVDDGSSDNTEEVITGFIDARIRYVRHQQNKGAGAARNTGIKLAKGKYIAFQDSDDEWLPTKLEIQIKAFDIVSPDVGVIYTDMLQIKKDGAKEYWHSPTVTYGYLINPITLNYQVWGIGIQSTLIKKECFDEVGHFDERFPRFIDLEIFIRLLKHYHFHHIKKPLVKYYVEEGISSNVNALLIARKLLLETYSEDIKKNGKFLANQYFLIGYALQSCGMFAEGKSYITKAIKKNPINIKFLLIGVISLLGQKTFVAISKVYRNINNLK